MLAVGGHVLVHAIAVADKVSLFSFSHFNPVGTIAAIRHAGQLHCRVSEQRPSIAAWYKELCTTDFLDISCTSEEANMPQSLPERQA